MIIAIIILLLWRTINMQNAGDTIAATFFLINLREIATPTNLLSVKIIRWSPACRRGGRAMPGAVTCAMTSSQYVLCASLPTATVTRWYSASSSAQSRPNCSTPACRRGSATRWTRSQANRRRNTARALRPYVPVCLFHSRPAHTLGLKACTAQRNWTELNWHGLVFDELRTDQWASSGAASVAFVTTAVCSRTRQLMTNRPALLAHW